LVAAPQLCHKPYQHNVRLTVPAVVPPHLPLPLPLQGSPAFSCALGPQLRSNSIAGFDRDKQVYSKQELSPLPFQPPPFHTYATSMLAGTFKAS
jgi:hypothetical protein